MAALCTQNLENKELTPLLQATTYVQLKHGTQASKK